MSKTTKPATIAFKSASAKLLNQVEGVIAEAKKHTFSVSRVFAAYNEVFNLKETPQTCASCLRSRAEKLESWYAAGRKDIKGTVNEAPAIMGADTAHIHTPITVNANGELSGEPDFPVTYIIVDHEEHFAVEEDGVTISRVVFTPAEEGAAFGIATYGDGTPAPAFVYKQGEKAFAVNGNEGQYTEVTGEPVAMLKSELFLLENEAHFAKLAELGITEDSTDAELLEALQLLNADATEDEKAFIEARIEGVQDKIANEVLTANAESASLAGSGITVLSFEDESAPKIHFVTEDKSAAVLGSKGTVKHADGSNVKTGTHALADGNRLAVAVGGRATIK